MKSISFLYTLAFLCLMTITVSAQTKSCSKMSMEECAAKMGMTVEECKKLCPAMKGSTSLASSVEVLDLPDCCYSKLSAEGKACCAKYSAQLASASKIVDVDGVEMPLKTYEYAKRKCSMFSSDSDTKVASVIMVRSNDLKAKPTKKKSCSMTCLGKKATKA